MGKYSTHEIIGGYRVPGGQGGAAVRFACERVLAHPGISQVSLLKEASSFAGLNLSTATWITSPSSKSPATILWDRRKVGSVYCCFPNDLTDKCTGSFEAILRVWEKIPMNCDWETAMTLSPGDLVLRRTDGAFVTFHGWAHLYTSRVFDSLDSAARHLVSGRISGYYTGYLTSPYPLWSVDGRMLKSGESSLGTSNSRSPFIRV